MDTVREAALQFNVWFSHELTRDYRWIIYAVRTLTFLSVIFVLAGMFARIRSHKSHELWFIIIPNLAFALYYFNQLYIAPISASTTVTPAIIFFNLCLISSYLGAGVVVYINRNLEFRANKAIGEEYEKRRKSVIGFWRWRKSKQTLPTKK